MKYLYLFLTYFCLSITLKSQIATLSPDGRSKDELFGKSIERLGDYLLVGSQSAIVNGKTSGAVYVYDINNGYELKEKLTSRDPEEQEWFGLGLSSSGKYLAIGNRNDDKAGYNTGSVYIYTLNHNKLIHDTVLTSSCPVPFGSFGKVSLDKNTLAVGSTEAMVDGQRKGAVYVFENNGKSWKETNIFSPSDLRGLAAFGNVVVNNNIMVAGAHKDQVDKGAVYVFRKNDSGEWAQVAKVTAPDGIPGDIFGHTIAIHGGNILIGADKEATGDMDTGAAYLFEDDGKSLKFIQKFTPPDGNSGDRFGSLVVVYKDKIFIGAKRHNKAGAVYEYDKMDGKWMFNKKISPPDFQEGMMFGDAMFIDDKIYAISAPGFDKDAEDQGIVYVYRNSK